MNRTEFICGAWFFCLGEFRWLRGARCLGSLFDYLLQLTYLPTPPPSSSSLFLFLSLSCLLLFLSPSVSFSFPQLSYLLGNPVQSTVLSAWEARFPKDGGSTAGAAVNNAAGTAFFDLELNKAGRTGQLGRSVVDRYCIIVMAGIAAEALCYGEAEGGRDDEAALVEFLANTVGGPWGKGEGLQEMARWSALNALDLLKEHREMYESLVAELEKGRGERIGDVMVAIDSPVRKEIVAAAKAAAPEAAAPETAAPKTAAVVVDEPEGDSTTPSSVPPPTPPSSSSSTSTPTPTSAIIMADHLNLNHAQGTHPALLTFYRDVLGMVPDPRKAENIEKGEGTVWMNAGATQFHLSEGKPIVVLSHSCI